MFHEETEMRKLEPRNNFEIKYYRKMFCKYFRILYEKKSTHNSKCGTRNREIRVKEYEKSSKLIHNLALEVIKNL